MTERVYDCTLEDPTDRVRTGGYMLVFYHWTSLDSSSS
jgi:hypothetical protein